VVNAANDNFGALGYAIIGVFVASWLISLVVYRVMGYDKLNP
jgi:high-affinity nickel-transport protein